MATPTKKSTKSKWWKESHYVEAHGLSRQGLSKRAIAAAMGVPWDMFRYWMRTKDAFRAAVESGRSQTAVHNKSAEKDVLKPGGETYVEFVYKRLPSDLKELWDELNVIDKPDKNGNRPVFVRNRIDKLFDKSGIKMARQHLWLHALICSNFNANEACRKVGVSRSMVHKWCDDPAFLRLYKEVPEMQKEFAESALFRNISQGSDASIKFALQCIYPEKYSPTKNINITGKMTQASIDVNRLLEMVSVEERRRLLEAMEAEEQQKIKSLGPAEILNIGE